MAVTDRSFSDVLQDIIGNVREIVRAEVRFAKTEFRGEAARAKHSAILVGAGGVAAAFAAGFLLLTIVRALEAVVPGWAASLLVGAALAVAAIVLLGNGLKRFKDLYPTAGLTAEQTKEKAEWAKQ